MGCLFDQIGKFWAAVSQLCALFRNVRRQCLRRQDYRANAQWPGRTDRALVVMDAGIATEANLIWLGEHGYRYLVVSRERARQFEAETAIPI